MENPYSVKSMDVLHGKTGNRTKGLEELRNKVYLSGNGSMTSISKRTCSIESFWRSYNTQWDQLHPGFENKLMPSDCTRGRNELIMQTAVPHINMQIPGIYCRSPPFD